MWFGHKFWPVTFISSVWLYQFANHLIDIKADICLPYDLIHIHILVYIKLREKYLK